MIFPQSVFSVCFLWLFIIGVIITVAMLWSVLIVGIVIDLGGATFSSLGKLVPEIPIPEIPIPSIPNPMNVIFQNKCMEALGCFYTGPPFFHPLNRPLSFTPTDKLETKFLLFTPSHPEEEVLELTSESIRNSSFNPRLPLKVLIHGYRADLDVDDIRFQMKDALLNLSDYNVVVVDWSENNGPPYAQAVANARAVGAQLALLLKTIIDNLGYRAENIHLIGHSLGGHISGWAGERIPNLGRISGLDPAGPYFQDADNIVRLDATDALFVDVIHTDGGENVVDGLGIGDPVGHVDFYPNGGRFQPGCAQTSQRTNVIGSFINATTSLVSNFCDHGRASNYFLESIDRTNCRFLAVWCNSYADFEKGDCLPQNSTLSEMGFYAKKIQGLPVKSKFFLRTNESSPFCIEDSVYL